MTLTELLMQGLMIPYSDQPVPVDFIVVNARDGITMVFMTGWQYGTFQRGDGIGLIEGVPRVEGDIVSFTGQAFHAYRPDDEDEAAAVARMRAVMDERRGDYMRALLTVRDQNTEFDFTDWITAVMARPVKEAQAEYERKTYAERDIAAVTLMSGERVVDALVLDGFGNATAYDPGGRLQGFAAQWPAKAGKVSLADYIRWVVEQPVYGDSVFGQPIYGWRKGHVEDVARELVNG